MKNTARNKQIVFFADSRKTVKLKLFLEKAKKGHSGEFLDIYHIKMHLLSKNDEVHFVAFLIEGKLIFSVKIQVFSILVHDTGSKVKNLDQFRSSAVKR